MLYFEFLWCKEQSVQIESMLYFYILVKADKKQTFFFQMRNFCHWFYWHLIRYILYQTKKIYLHNLFMDRQRENGRHVCAFTCMHNGKLRALISWDWVILMKFIVVQTMLYYKSDIFRSHCFSPFNTLCIDILFIFVGFIDWIGILSKYSKGTCYWIHRHENHFWNILFLGWL